MNIYQAIRYAASQGWSIHFYPAVKEVSIESADPTIRKPGTTLAHQAWHSITGVINPATAMIRAIDEAKKKAG